MEYENENENKIGAGILIICILHFIGAVLQFLVSYLGPALITPEIASQYRNFNRIYNSFYYSNCNYIYSYDIACIMLLLKQKIGVFLYFFTVLANILITIALNGFSIISLILALILPVLMGIFISKKKELYGFGTK